MRGSPSGPLEVLVQDLSITFAQVNTITAADQAVVVPGSLLGDTVLCSPQGVYVAGLTLPQGRCLVDGTVQFRICNPTAGNLTPGAALTCRLTTLRARP